MNVRIWTYAAWSLAGVALAMPRLAPAQATRNAPVFVSLDQQLESGGIKLSGGKAANPDDWKSIATSITETEKCTASLVGPQVIATSAHCLDGSPAAPVAMVLQGTIVFGSKTFAYSSCAIHPDYAKAPANGGMPRNGRDYGLCRLDRPVPDVDPETIAPDGLADGGAVVLLGLGCTGLKIVNGRVKPDYDPPGKPVLRIGDQRIAKTAQALGQSGATLAVTFSKAGEPNVCPGDSGGPVLVGVKATKPTRGRLVAGFNAAFDATFSSLGGSVVFKSYLAPAGTSFRNWARAWSDAQGVTICGIQVVAGIAGCRL